VELSSITIDSRNNTFVVEQNVLIDILCHKLIRDFSRSPRLNIPSHIEILCSECFSYCNPLSSVSFERKSRLTRVESRAFYRLSCTIVIPSTVLFIPSDLGVNPFQLVF
jgi:hypothetical protein